MNLQNQIDYLREYDLGDMFDECSVPQGLDMARVRGAIVMRCGLMIPLFSEPLTQRAATQQFFFENQWNFEHVLNVLKAQYSPIENVAEVREETTTSSGTDSLKIDHNLMEKHSGTDGRVVQESGTTISQESGTTSSQESGTTSSQESGTTSSQESGTTAVTGSSATDRQESGSTRTERKISAENISTYSPDNEETVSHGMGEETTVNHSETTTHGRGDTVTHGKGDTVTHGKGDTVTHGKADTLTHGKKTEDDFTHGHEIAKDGFDVHSGSKESQSTFSVNRHGNLGVTTNQDMINQELDLLIRFNAYRFIADLYEKELILGVY